MASTMKVLCDAHGLRLRESGLKKREDVGKEVASRVEVSILQPLPLAGVDRLDGGEERLRARFVRLAPSSASRSDGSAA